MTLTEIAKATFANMKVEDEIPGYDAEKVNNYMRLLESNYPNNPFHNALHAADVGQSVHIFLQQQCATNFTPLEKFALVLAAFAHDVGHNGKNNDFLIKTRDPVATRFNNQSPLEMMHAHLALELVEKDDTCNFLQGMAPADQTRFREIVIKTILGTDNALHFEKLKKLQDLIAAGNGAVVEKHKSFFMEILLHAADISNPSKLYENDGPYKKWCENVMTEFYALGDLEQAHGLPVTDLFKRSKPVHAVQMGFTSYFVKPLYVALGKINGFDATCMLDNIETNLSYWQRVKSAAEEAAAVPRRRRKTRRNALCQSMMTPDTMTFLQTLSVEG